jgi:hypothetical protein
MPRRALSWTLLALVALQLLGSMAFAAVCFEPCPDDTGESSCPPVCTTCATCAHSRQAILQGAFDGVAFDRAPHAFPPQVLSASTPPASDIFHVPLHG